MHSCNLCHLHFVFHLFSSIGLVCEDRLIKLKHTYLILINGSVCQRLAFRMSSPATDMARIVQIHHPNFYPQPGFPSVGSEWLRVFTCQIDNLDWIKNLYCVGVLKQWIRCDSLSQLPQCLTSPKTCALK